MACLAHEWVTCELVTSLIIWGTWLFVTRDYELVRVTWWHDSLTNESRASSYKGRDYQLHVTMSSWESHSGMTRSRVRRDSLIRDSLIHQVSCLTYHIRLTYIYVSHIYLSRIRVSYTSHVSERDTIHSYVYATYHIRPTYIYVSHIYLSRIRVSYTSHVYTSHVFIRLTCIGYPFIHRVACLIHTSLVCH